MTDSEKESIEARKKILEMISELRKERWEAVKNGIREEADGDPKKNSK